MAIKFVREKYFLNEINEKGEKERVRSTDSSTRVFLRFTNKTSRTVDVWWRDFRGTRHLYVCLEPDAFADINSFVTHPWEFTDSSTQENYVINNCIIFRAPKNIGGMKFRTNWNITVGVRSLKYCTLLEIAQRMVSVQNVQTLGLPKTLEAELEKLVHTLLTQPNEVEVRDS